MNETVEKVDDLWKIRMKLAPKHKQKRIRIFYDVFYELTNDLKNEREFSIDDIKNSRYWEYIKGYHPSWQVVPLASKDERRMRTKFRDAMFLFNDIKEVGMKNPIEMIKEGDKKRCIMKGYRRLVILKILGIKEAKILTHESFNSYSRSE